MQAARNTQRVPTASLIPNPMKSTFGFSAFANAPCQKTFEAGTASVDPALGLEADEARRRSIATPVQTR